MKVLILSLFAIVLLAFHAPSSQAEIAHNFNGGGGVIDLGDIIICCPEGATGICATFSGTTAGDGVLVGPGIYIEHVSWDGGSYVSRLPGTSVGKVNEDDTNVSTGTIQNNNSVEMEIEVFTFEPVTE